MFYIGSIVVNHLEENFIHFFILFLFIFVFKDRIYWQHSDPIHLAEGLFAIGTVSALVRLCFVFYIYRQLGPLQITLGKMIKVN
jgi:hypothetical protein